jgi:hypothetical protein
MVHDGLKLESLSSPGASALRIFGMRMTCASLWSVLGQYVILEAQSNRVHFAERPVARQ